MHLHDHLTQTLDRVDPDGPDLLRLTAVAERRGTRLRRRRTAGLAVAASVAALGLTGGVLAAVGGTGDSGTTLASVQPNPDGATAPTTGRGAVLALQWAVDEQRDGTVSDLAGQYSQTSGDYYVELHWDDADGLGDSLVGLNVQHGRGMHADCSDPTIVDCQQTQLPDGSRMTTYEERADVPGGPGTRYVVDVLRPDRIRIVAASTNGFEINVEGGAWDRTRPAPPLSVDDLTAIALQPMWGDDLPASFVEAGQDLTSYLDLDDDRGDWVR